MPELHHLNVLFWTNLVSNISTKESKSTIFNATQLARFGANKCRLNAHFSWVKNIKETFVCNLTASNH